MPERFPNRVAIFCKCGREIKNGIERIIKERELHFHCECGSDVLDFEIAFFDSEKELQWDERVGWTPIYESRGKLLEINSDLVMMHIL